MSKHRIHPPSFARNTNTVRTLCVCALLCAASVTLGYIAKVIFGTGPLRVTFENLPIIFSGMVFGPLWGTAVGVIADLLSCLFAGQAPLPLITVGTAVVGMVAGISAYSMKKRTFSALLVTELSAQMLGSALIKSLALLVYYPLPALLPRIPIYIGIAIAETSLLYTLFKNPAIEKFIQKEQPMTYKQAVDYIHSVTWKGSRPGLERITKLLDALDHPERSLRFVHVAGTNGKGSVSAMTESILRKAGYKTGLFVSPYIKHFNERIQFMGKPISNHALAKATQIVRHYADAMADKPTEFELITAIGFVYFKQCGCDIVVLEVGMGGRLDSTNIIEAPLVSIITGIALDHTAFLGDTIEKIAAEKAGIIKEGCPVVYGGYDAAARLVIQEKANTCHAPLTAAADVPLHVESMTLDGTVLSYGDQKQVYIPLLGAYQPQNAATVLCAVDALRKRGLVISDTDVRIGLKEVCWRGRFEVLCREPLVISDGAHNPEGIQAAAQSLRLYFQGTPVVLLCGVMADKDHAHMVEQLSSLVSEVFTVRPDNPRALSAEDLAQQFRKHHITAHPKDTMADAVQAATACAKATHTALVCLGSLYMYEELTDALDTISKGKD